MDLSLGVTERKMAENTLATANAGRIPARPSGPTAERPTKYDRFMRLSLIAAAALSCLLVAAVPVSGQSADMQAMAQSFGVSSKQNAAALKMYTWKMRVEVALRGEAKPATLDEDPVDGTVEFATVGGGGPNYAARTTVNAPGKKLTAKLENFEYVRQ